jgi:hypothetical protein
MNPRPPQGREIALDAVERVGVYRRLVAYMKEHFRCGGGGGGAVDAWRPALRGAARLRCTSPAPSTLIGPAVVAGTRCGSSVIAKARLDPSIPFWLADVIARYLSSPVPARMSPLTCCAPTHFPMGCNPQHIY